MRNQRSGKPDAAGPAAVRKQFNRSCDVHLADRAAPLPTLSRLVPGAEGNVRLVDLDQILEQGPVLHHHGPADLLQQKPGRLAAAEAKLGLQLERRDAVGVARHNMERGKPRLQRQMAAVNEGAGGHRGLLAASGALHRHPSSRNRIAVAASAVGA